MRSRKLIYLLSVFGLIIVNCLYESYQFMITLIVVVAVGIFSLLVEKISAARGILYVLFNKDRVTFGDDVEVGVKFDNGCFFRTPWAQANLIIRCSDGVHEKRTVKVSRYNRREKLNMAVFGIKPNHCGVMYLYMDTLTIRDYMHMFSDTLRYDFVRKAYVFPQVIKAEEDYDADAQLEESSKVSLHKRDNDEIIDMRDYREGDPLNRIHWNLSSVYDDYIVKQYAEEVDTRAYICADLTLYDRENFRDDLDKIYQWVYSIATRIVEHGGTVVLVAWDDNVSKVYEGEASELSLLDDCMEQLMDIKCSKEALVNMDRAMDWNSREMQKQPMVITNGDYNSDIYQILRVDKDDILEVLAEI